MCIRDSAENVVSALDLVAVEELEAPGDEIEIAGLDGMIDLSPAIGQYAELSYFQNTEVRFPVDMDFSEIEEYKDLLLSLIHISSCARSPQGLCRCR